jgi:hypothetical protein
VTDSSATLPHGWRYGVHPGAAGTRVRSLGRVELPIGEALRLETENVEPGGEDVVHVQYYIDTDAGGWALWLSCARGDLAGYEAAVEALTPPFTDEA